MMTTTTMETKTDMMTTTTMETKTDMMVTMITATMTLMRATTTFPLKRRYLATMYVPLTPSSAYSTWKKANTLLNLKASTTMKTST